MAFKVKVGDIYRNHQDQKREYKVEAKIDRMGLCSYFCVRVVDGLVEPRTVWVNEEGKSKNGIQIFGPVRVNKVGYAVMAFSEGGLRTITSPIFDTQEAAIPHIKNAETDLIANVQYSEELADDAPAPPIPVRDIYADMAARFGAANDEGQEMEVFRHWDGPGAEAGALNEAVREDD